MIEDKKDGIKIAKDPEEAFWIEFKERCEKQIINDIREITIQENLVKLADTKLEKWKKNSV